MKSGIPDTAKVIYITRIYKSRFGVTQGDKVNLCFTQF